MFKHMHLFSYSLQRTQLLHLCLTGICKCTWTCANDTYLSTQSFQLCLTGICTITSCQGPCLLSGAVKPLCKLCKSTQLYDENKSFKRSLFEAYIHLHKKAWLTSVCDVYEAVWVSIWACTSNTVSITQSFWLCSTGSWALTSCQGPCLVSGAVKPLYNLCKSTWFYDENAFVNRNRVHLCTYASPFV